MTSSAARVQDDLIKPPGPVSRQESLQIDYARILCIFFMVSVHIYPDMRMETILYQGPLHGLWVIWIDFFGRASVAALSCITGYILFQQRNRKSAGSILIERARSLYWPMVVFNVIKIALIAVLLLAQTGNLASLGQRLGIENIMDALNLVFALTDHPANIPLGFLRDLLVSLVIIRLLLPCLEKFGLILLAIFVVCSLFELGSPVILRSNVFLFVFVGAFLAQRGLTLEFLSSAKVALGTALAFGCLFVIAHLFTEPDNAVQTQLKNMLKRFCLVFVIFYISSVAASRFELPDLPFWRQVLFITFLSHGITSQVLSKVWEVSGLSTMSPYYLLYFASNLVIFFLVGFALQYCWMMFRKNILQTKLAKANPDNSSRGSQRRLKGLPTGFF